jgi:hypothetical protein
MLAFSFSQVASAAKPDQEQTAGGWGQTCNSGTVNCSSGRALSCTGTAADNNSRSECTQHTGTTGWVSCRIYDTAGNTTSSYSDTCP